MANVLRAYFPMLKSREDILEQIHGSRELKFKKPWRSLRSRKSRGIHREYLCSRSPHLNLSSGGLPDYPVFHIREGMPD